MASRLLGRGGLRARAVSSRTARLYREAFELFCEFVLRNYAVVVDENLPAPTLDIYCEAYFNSLYDFYAGTMQHLAVRTHAGIYQELGFRYKGFLQDSNRCLVAWRRLHPPSSHRPLPRRLLDIIALTVALRGERYASLAMLIAFEGYLRVSEVLALRREDVLLPGDMRGSRTACGIRILQAKTGRHQFARVVDRTTVLYLRWLVDNTAPGARLFPGLYAVKLNRLLSWSARVLGVPPVFTMHSLRHGRASEAMLANEPPDAIRRAGRWSTLHSMEPYLQACVSLALSISLPPPLSPFLAAAPQLRRLLLVVSAAQ